MAKVFLKTYGCQMNARDSEQVARMLVDRGHELVPAETGADVVLFNTCAVRASAERRVLGRVASLRPLRRVRPGLVIGLLGCVAQERGAELARLGSGVDLVAGTQKFHRVADMVDRLLSGRASGPLIDVGAEEGSQRAIRDHLAAGGSPVAFVSVMQGCDMRCSFCVVPATRGRERARPESEIVEEVRRLAIEGVREVTLLGQIVNRYGRRERAASGSRTPFVRLLEAVHAVEGIDRIRFASSHPLGFGPDLVDAWRRLPKLCEHVHLPVQSGSDRLLRRMRRGYTREGYLRLAHVLRDARPGMAITTDLIAGFPGETEEDHLLTLDLVERVGFDNAFVFLYSPRPGTRAAVFPDPVPADEAARRHADLLDAVNRLARQSSAAWVGRDVEVLCEGPSKADPTRFSGRTRQNKIVVFRGARRHIGGLIDVRITEATSQTLYGEADELDAAGRFTAAQPGAVFP